MSDEQIIALDAVNEVLDELDYFQVLKLQPDATISQIKAAFYRESRAYHPDRFYHLADTAVKEKVNEVYKRVTEAYYVLRDDARRRQYTADISGPDRKQKLRFTEASETETKQAQRKAQEEQIGTTPKGRQFYTEGMKDFEAGRWQAALRNFKSALMYEPQNARYKEKVAESEQKVHEQSKSSGGSFTIK